MISLDRQIFGSVLLIYIVLLVLASAPRFIRIGPISRAQSFSRAALSMIGVSSGLELFYRPFAEPKKIDSECLQITFYRLGSVREITSFPRNCIWQKSLFADPYEIMFHRWTEEVAVAHALKNQTRELKLEQSFAKRVCKTLNSDSNDNSIVVQWFQNKVDYETNEKTKVLQLYFFWDCKLNSLQSIYWYPNIPQSISHE